MAFLPRYVGVYAWDHLDTGFMALTPRPNGGMTGQLDAPKLGNSWSTLADACQLADPLAPSQAENDAQDGDIGSDDIGHDQA